MDVRYENISNEADQRYKKKFCQLWDKIKLCHFLLFLVLILLGATCIALGLTVLWEENIKIHQLESQEVQNLSSKATHYKNFVTKLVNKEKLNEIDIQNFAEQSPYTSELFEQIEQKSIKNGKDFTFPKGEIDQCDVISVTSRFDCLPEGGSSAQCIKRGCCWSEPSKIAITSRKNIYTKLHPSYVKENKTNAKTNVPYCYYPLRYSMYKLTDFSGTQGTYTRHAVSGYPNDVDSLRLEIRYETCSRLRIRIYDANNGRWETPLPSVPKNSPGCPGKTLYNVEVLPQNGLIVVRRDSSGVPIFDMRKAAPLIFSDQFIQISTLLPSPYIYGLGQHLDGLLLDTFWTRRMLWNADLQPDPKWNLYGSHPFYMVMEHSGSSHGVFLLNSNAIEVVIQPTPALTFRTIGGIIDMYVFLGPSPDDVISQYTEVIGRPFLPPYWSLGYHQCRFGYNSVANTIKVWKRTRDAGIPFDVQWNDIDYMKNQNDFTIGKAFEGLPEFVNQLHKLGMHYVIITDPGISGGETPGEYPPYDLGISSDVFVKNSTGQLFIGKVWNPTATVFPDFTRPNSVIYWNFLIRKFRDQLPFDGLWIDMNEPSNFWDGQANGCPKDSPLEHPPYLPLVYGGNLYSKTLCMTAKHHLGPHYNIHNLYGFTEAITTYAALSMTPGIPDPFIISRATFPGIGAFAGHWTGDVHSDWFNLWKSIGDVLTMNIHGIPMVGADICGFNGNTTAALCNRWMQLGAFYPFARNHNTDDGIDQDPVAMGEQVVKSSIKALLQRYKLLPFLYTLFVKAHFKGIPVAKPLFFKNPEDLETYSIDTQFMWGDELMIVPELEEDSTFVVGYFPKGKWYDWYTGAHTSNGREYVKLNAPIDTIPLFVAGGSILPCQNPANTTTQSRLNPFGLIVALNNDSRASGELHWNKPEEPGHVHWEFTAIPNHIYSVPSFYGEKNESLTIDWIQIFGISKPVFVVEINGNKVSHTYTAVTQVLNIENISLDFKHRLTVYFT